MPQEHPENNPHGSNEMSPKDKAYLSLLEGNLWPEEDMTPEANDTAETDSMRPRLQEARLDREAQQRSEQAALDKIGELTLDQMPGQGAALDQQIASERPEDVIASNAFGQLRQDIANHKPGINNLIEPTPDNDVSRQVYRRVFDLAGLADPIPELEADNRNRLSKFLRPKSRKTVTIVRQGNSFGTPIVLSATRSYSKETDRYELRLYGGTGEGSQHDPTKQPAAAHESTNN